MSQQTNSIFTKTVRLKFILFSFLVLLTASCFAQDKPDTSSCHTSISLLTCTPGEELYSTFGHSAIRVKDSTQNLDAVFNYGTFDFDDPDFYKKFVRGKLLYFVSVTTLDRFLMEYEYYKRGVTEQVLNLDCKEKKQLTSFLFENAKEENKYYKYDFTHDNCTTRLLNMIEKSTNDSLIFKNIIPKKNTSFRDLIHEYLDLGEQYWSKLGIDILLGAPLDKPVSNKEAMFLPDYLMKGLDSCALRNQSLILSKSILLSVNRNKQTKSPFTPLVVFSVLLLIVAVLSFIPNKGLNVWLKTFDVFLFLLCGLIGLLILFMWFGTEHVMCRDNFNLLWALPTHSVAAFFLFSKKEITWLYFRFVFYYSIALLLAWFFLPQQMNNAIIPIIGIIIIRSYFICKRYLNDSIH